MADTVFVTVFVAVIAVISVTSTAFFSNVFNIIALGVFEVVLGSFKLIRTVCSVSSESAYSGGVHRER